MSGPQGSDPNQPWSGQPPSDPAWQPQAPEQPQPEQPGWGQQPPAYGQQPPAYGGQQYQQPPYGQPQYPQADQYAQQPTAYGPSSYPQQSPYAPQPPYGQQPYGQPQPGPYDPNQPYGQPPGQYDPNQQFSPYSTTDAGSKKSKGVVLGVVGALVAVILIVVGVLGFWKPGWFVTTNLDVKAAQSGVQQILSDQTNGYGAKNVQDVTCNHGANPKVVKGGTFDCEVSIDGTKRQVTVTFQDDSGTYEVGRPR